MKTKPKEPPKTTEAVVTSTARLTIQGQTFEMPLAELEHLYGVIGEALGKKRPKDIADEYKKLIEDAKKHREEYPPPIWPISMPYTPPINTPSPFPYRGPQTPLYEVWCSVGDDSRADPHISSSDRAILSSFQTDSLQL